MSELETLLAAVRAAGLRVITAGEDDNGTWLATVATGRMAHMKTWRAGRGPTLEAALRAAMKRKAPALPKPAPVAADEPFEDLV